MSKLSKNKIKEMIVKTCEAYFDPGAVGLPQNISKSSVPADLLRQTTKNPDDIIWIYNRDRFPRYRGVLVSHKLLSYRRARNYFNNRKCIECIDGNHYVLYRFEPRGN